MDGSGEKLMRQSNKKSCKYIIYFLMIMLVGFLWIGYPSAPFKDFVLENILSPVFSAFIVLSWTKVRIGKNYRDKFDYFVVMILMFFVLVCMIGQTYQNLNLKEAFWNVDKIILKNVDKILILFLIPLVVGFFTDRFVFKLEKLEHSK